MRRFVLILAASLLGPLAAAGVSAPTVDAPAGAGPFNGLAIALADFWGDGHTEIVAQSDSGNAFVLDPTSGRVLAQMAPGNAGCTTTCYQFEGVTGPINAPAIADVDKDGKLDVILGDTAAVVARFSFDPAHSTTTSYAFTKVWERRFSDFGAWTMDAAPVLGDLTGNGQQDVVVSTEENGIFAVKPDGSLLWSANRPGGHATPGVRDLDGDGHPEVVVPRDDGVVDVYNGATGAIKWSVNVGVNPGSIPASALLSDVNGDGHPDVVVTARDAHDATIFTNDHFVMIAYDSWGHQLWRFSPSWGAPMSHTRPMLVNVGGRAAVLGADWNTIGHKPGNFERVGPGHAFLVDARTGAEIWHHDLNALTQSNKDLVVADMVGDGTQQVIVEGTSGSSTDGLLTLDLATGAQKAFYPTSPWVVTRGAAAGDLFGDGHFALAVPTAQGSAGAVLIYHGTQALNAMFPGWAAVNPPKGSPGTAPSPTPSPTPTPSGNFTATFTNPRGNEWWVEVDVSGSPSVTGVSASLNGGAPQGLPKTSWGSWANSLHAPAGTIVQFTARDAAGDTAASSCYQWTAVTLVTCPGGATSPPPTAPPPSNNTTSPPPPPPSNSTFSATFRPSTNGNDWWVETYLTTSGGTLTEVDARVDGGAWVALTHESWGSWAKSIHAPTGSTVEFQARDASGDTVVSQAYTWPVR